MPDAPPNRCRIVLVAPLGLGPDLAPRLQAALAAADVASVILPQGDLPEREFQARAEPLVRLAQDKGAAAVIAGPGNLAFRLNADGVHVEGRAGALREEIERAGGRIAVGASGAKTRDEALALGEQQPDYLFFGRFGFDEKPEPHPRNLALGRWWAEMIAIPAVVMAGSDPLSVAAVAQTGVEFVGLSAALFNADGRDPADSLAKAEAILEERAPRWTAPT